MTTHVAPAAMSRPIVGDAAPLWIAPTVKSDVSDWVKASPKEWVVSSA